MERKEYSAGAVKWSFWFLEFKKMVLLLQQGLSVAEIRQKNTEENLFSASSAARSKLIMNTVAARIQSIPESFISEFAVSDAGTQKLYCLTGCMCHDTLFFEFVYEVIREKMILGTDRYTDSDLRIFFAEKQAQSVQVSRWTDDTLKRLGRCYKTMLYEAGLTDKGKQERKILRPILYPEMEKWLRGNELEPVWKIFRGGGGRMTFEERLDQMEAEIHKPSFRRNRGRANEVNYWVFDYPPQRELEVRERVEYMREKNARGNDEFELVVFDLYDMIIDVLEEEDYIEQTCRFEERKGFERIIKAVGNLLRVNDDDSMMVEHIRNHTPENAVVFLTGIGKCYPILRSHKILNNLSQSFGRVPVVLFFPGTYDEQSLMLFDGSRIKSESRYACTQ